MSFLEITGSLFWGLIAAIAFWAACDIGFHYVKCLKFAYRIKKHRPKFKPIRFANSILFNTPDAVTFQNPHMRFEWVENER